MDQEARPAGGTREGLIIGKFLPFHAGHRQLIEHARTRCENVTVVVFSRSAEIYPGELRAAWIRAECADVRVVHSRADYPDPWDEISWRYWVDACREISPRTTHIFTSEEYGDELARRLGIAHIRVDPGRHAFPVSGSAIRQDPIANWRYVPDAVRPSLVRKVAIVGAESTGKTTLAERLAEHYGTAWTPEFGREYCEQHSIESLSPDDLLSIAVEQARLEDGLAVQSSGLLVCDTDLMVTRAWSQHLCGTVHPGIAEAEGTRRYDLHLLTSLLVPWINDGTRVCGDQAVREWFHQRYKEELHNRGALHIELPSREGDAFALACNSIETLWPSVRP